MRVSLKCKRGFRSIYSFFSTTISMFRSSLVESKTSSPNARRTTSSRTAPHNIPTPVICLVPDLASTQQRAARSCRVLVDAVARFSATAAMATTAAQVATRGSLETVATAVSELPAPMERAVRMVRSPLRMVSMAAPVLQEATVATAAPVDFSSETAAMVVRVPTAEQAVTVVTESRERLHLRLASLAVPAVTVATAAQEPSVATAVLVAPVSFLGPMVLAAMVVGAEMQASERQAVPGTPQSPSLDSDFKMQEHQAAMAAMVATGVSVGCPALVQVKLRTA